MPGVAEIVVSVEGERRRTRLFRWHEQPELLSAIADMSATFAAKGWT